MEEMKKIIFTLAAACIMMTACNQQQESKQDNTAEAERDSLLDVINRKDGELNELMGTFGEIQEGFRRINEAEGKVNIDKNSLESSSSVADIKQNISMIEATVRENRELIEKLKTQLRNSSLNATKLREAINNLTTELEQKTAMIEQLREELRAKDVIIGQQTEQISNLNTENTSLKEENTDRSKTIEQQDKQLNTAWFVFGNKSELKEQKILQNGDVLRSDNFNKNYFTKIDIRVDKVIKLYSKSAKILTNHPEGSYTLDKDSKGQYVLNITNPTSFWSTSKFLVVLVK
jgi:chromosome segregation ATPase